MVEEVQLLEQPTGPAVAGNDVRVGFAAHLSVPAHMSQDGKMGEKKTLVSQVGTVMRAWAKDKDWPQLGVAACCQL